MSRVTLLVSFPSDTSHLEIPYFYCRKGSHRYILFGVYAHKLYELMRISYSVYVINAHIVNPPPKHHNNAHVGVSSTIHIGKTDSKFKATKSRSCLVRTSKSVVTCRHMTMTTLLDINDANRFFSRITRGTNTTMKGRAASM